MFGNIALLFLCAQTKEIQIAAGFKRKDVTNRMEHDKFLTMR